MSKPVALAAPAVTFNNSAFWPRVYFTCFTRFSERIAISSLGSSNLSMMGTQGVCCEIRTEFYILLRQMSIFKRRLFTELSQIRPRFRSREFHVRCVADKTAMDRFFCENFGFSLQYYCTNIPYSSSSIRCFYRLLKKGTDLSEIVEYCIEKHFQFFIVQRVTTTLMLISTSNYDF